MARLVTRIRYHVMRLAGKLSGRPDFTGLGELKSNWDALAKHDPLWAILSHPDKLGGKWDKDMFFGTGRREVGELMRYVEGTGVRHEHGVALDFGCGVGRLTQALAEHYDSVDGVDISSEMLRQAEGYNRYPGKVRYINNTADTLPFPDGAYDLVYANIVLQHMEKDYALRYVREFVRVLKPGGLAIFQAPSRYGESTEGKYVTLLDTPDGMAEVSMNIIPGPEINAAVTEAGGTLLDTVRTNMSGDRFESIRYCVAKAPVTMEEVKADITELDGFRLPPGPLRFRVAGSDDAEWFLKSGEASVRDIERALSVVGTRFSDYGRILDFGCGCGRILIHLEEVGRSSELYGVDIDPDTVGWCRDNLPWARCSVNQGLPPLDFGDDFFDLIYNQSVFTHLDEEYQDKWLAELARVTKPGGTVVLSVAGEHPFDGLVKEWTGLGVDVARHQKEYREKGIIYIAEDGYQDGPFPDFYHSTFHAPEYVFRHWSRFFDIKAYIVRGSLDFQDFVLLGKRAS